MVWHGWSVSSLKVKVNIFVNGLFSCQTSFLSSGLKCFNYASLILAQRLSKKPAVQSAASRPSTFGASRLLLWFLCLATLWTIGNIYLIVIFPQLLKPYQSVLIFTKCLLFCYCDLVFLLACHLYLLLGMSLAFKDITWECLLFFLSLSFEIQTRFSIWWGHHTIC